MSNELVLEIIKTGGIIITSILSLIGIIIGVKNKNRTGLLNGKVDEYHKEVNGKMGELLDTTRQLGEKVGAEANQAKTDAKEQDKK